MDGSITPEQHEFILQQPQNSKLTNEASLACSLPLELYSEIFQAYLPPDGRLNLRNVSDVNLWKMGHVCSSWRAAITSTPQLWSNFTNNGNHWHEWETMIEDMQIRLASCLERSRSHPLSFSLTLSDSDFPSNLAKESYRWEHVNLSLSRASCFKPSSMNIGNLSILNSIEIFSYYNLDLSDLTDNILNRAPILSQLTLFRTYIPHTFIAPITFNHLTKLSLIATTFYSTGLSNLLSSTPNLIEFTWSELGADNTLDSTFSPIILPQLRMLFCTGSCEWLFNHLVVPRLDTLKLCDSSDINLSSTLFRRSLPHILSEFVVIGFVIHGSAIEIIKHLRFVERVVLEMTKNTDFLDFFHAVVVGHHEGSPFLTRIDELRVEETDPQACLRQGIISELNRLNIRFETFSRQSNEQAFRVFLSSGHSIIISVFSE